MSTPSAFSPVGAFAVNPEFSPNTTPDSTYFTYCPTLANDNTTGLYSPGTASQTTINIRSAGNNNANGNALWSATKAIRVKWRGFLATSGNNYITSAGLVDVNTDLRLQSSSSVSRGVRFVRDVGGNFWTVTGDGATNTRNQILGTSPQLFNTYEIIFTPGVSASFYLNGTLLFTHTTSLPSSANAILFGAGENDGTGASSYGLSTPIVSLQL